MSSAYLNIDQEYLVKVLLEMLAIPCPSGFTNEISRYVCNELDNLGLATQMTRRGSIITKVEGSQPHSARAIVNHLDTIGAQVKSCKENGRLELKPVGTWSSRFAEGGRVSIFANSGTYRGQVLPLLASGHAFNQAIDTLPISWENVEVRVDEQVHSQQDLWDLGIKPGDFVAFDSNPEVANSGFISARHLDNKAGAAALLAALKAVKKSGKTPDISLYGIFTITEEVGTGAGASLPKDTSEFVGIDIGPVAPGQNSKETGVSICVQDTSGPFDFHLTRKLKQICQDNRIKYQMDVFRYYYSDANSAVVAGNDIRDALITFGTDATHGYERTHVDSLVSIAELISHYAFSPRLPDIDLKLMK